VRAATLLLSGLAVSALASAGTGLLLYAADDAALRDITFWMLGSLGGATWSAVGAAAPALVLASLLALRLAHPLDVLLLGEAPAAHLGLDVPRVQRRVVVAATLATGAAVAVAGAVGFVGLLVPHLLRRLLGARHALLLPCTALCGAALVLLADVVARTLVAPSELPLGVVTALLGAPAFLAVLRRARPEAR
jgi:iron complex transport system permease protein